MKNALFFPNTPTQIELNQMHIWQIWLLKTSSKGKPAQLRLIYSWVVPSAADKQGWAEEVISSVNFEAEEKKPIKFELIRGDLFGTGAIISKYITGLLAGKYLSEVEIAGFEVPNAFINLNLGESDKEIAKKFSVRPEVLLPIDHLLVPWSHKTTPNPSGFSIFVNQLFFHPKTDLIAFDGFKEVREINIINQLTDTVKKATGFDFRKESAPRLGNIEWFRLPASDEDLYPLVSFWVNKGDKNIAKSVIVRFNALKNGIKDVLFRCRIINGEEVVLDEVREARWSDDVMEFEFQCSQPPSEIQVTVWEYDNTKERAAIIFEQSNVCMRTMATTMAIVGAQINSGRINLLDKLNGKEEAGKRSSLAKFSRSTSAGTTETGGYENDPWVSSSRSIISFMKELFPEKSEGQFFINGWDEQKGASGQLSFIEWILKIVSSESSGSLILLDPFLDKDGIEIFANARTANTQYHIITCTQHREKAGQTIDSVEVEDAVVSTPDKEGLVTKAALSIQDACEKMAPLLKGLNLTITDVRSEDKGKQQLFHDRYLLLLDKKGVVNKGFHLSNSLQGATRKAPLLVTPIPGDILGTVYRYVNELINPDEHSPTGKKIELVKLYPNNVKENEVTAVTVPDLDEESIGRLKDIPDPAFLFSTLLNDAELAEADLLPLKIKLKQLGIMDDEESSFLMYNVSPESLAVFADKLPSLSEDNFDKVINSLGEFLARSQTYHYEDRTELSSVYDGFDELVGQVKKRPELATKLVAYIKGYQDGLSERDRDRIFQLFNAEAFENIVELTQSHLNYMSGDFFGIKYSYCYACKLLVKCFPETAVVLLEDLIAKVVVLGWNEALPQVRSTLALISTLAQHVLRYFIYSDQTWWLQSKSYRIRAASAAPLIHGLLYDKQRSQSFEEVEQMLREGLPDVEYRLAISAFCSELYRRTNLADREELHEKSYKAISDNWIGDEQLICRVIKVLGGRLEYNHSYSISLNYLNILIEQGKLQVDWCMEFWNKVFTRKIQHHDFYVNTGSDSLPDHFSSHTDVKLTKTLIHYLSRCDADIQQRVVTGWIERLDPMWSVINQPFTSSSNFNGYDGACERILWIKILLEKSKADKLSPVIITVINEFLKFHQRELTLVEKYIGNKSFAPILELVQV